MARSKTGLATYNSPSLKKRIRVTNEMPVPPKKRIIVKTANSSPPLAVSPLSRTAQKTLKRLNKP